MTGETILTEIMGGDALSLPQAAKLVPSSRGEGASVKHVTLWRWAMHGSKAIDGRVVKLEAARVGGRLLTSKAALMRFMQSLSVAADDKPTPRQLDAANRRASDAASERLRAAGA